MVSCRTLTCVTVKDVRTNCIGVTVVCFVRAFIDFDNSSTGGSNHFKSIITDTCILVDAIVACGIVITIVVFTVVFIVKSICLASN